MAIRFNQNKYRNRKVEYAGHKFDSVKECERYKDLVLLLEAGEISNLRTQVKFPLVPSMKTPDGQTVRGIKYVADFTYYTKRGAFVVEDCKGVQTEVYKIKKKLLLDRYGYWIKET